MKHLFISGFCFFGVAVATAFTICNPAWTAFSFEFILMLVLSNRIFIVITDKLQDPQLSEKFRESCLIDLGIQPSHSSVFSGLKQTFRHFVLRNSDFWGERIKINEI